MKKQVTRYLMIVALFMSLFAVKAKAQSVSTFYQNQMGWPQGVTFDGAGNMYVAEANINTITKITPSGSASLFANLASYNYSPRGLAFDGTGNLCVANLNGIIQKISPAGVVSTFATTDAAFIYNPVFDAAGNMYVSNSAGCCRTFINNLYKITPAGTASSFAYFGTQTSTGSGSDGIGGVAIDASGNLYVAANVSGTFNGYISKITPAGVRSTFVPTSAGLFNPQAITIDASGNLYISDGHNIISKITPAGVISTYASNAPYAGGLAIDASGNLYGTVSSGYIYKVNTSGAISTFYSDALGYVNNQPQSMAIDASANIYVANPNTNTINKITSAGVVSTIAKTNLNQPTQVAIDASGNVYAYNNGDKSITKVTAAGVVSTLVTASASSTAGIQGPSQMITDAVGNLYMSDIYSNSIWKVTPAGVVSTYVTLSSTYFYNQYGLVFDNSGNLYVSTNNNNSIIKITPSKSASVFATGVNVGNLTMDAAGNIYVGCAGYNVNRISKVTTAGLVSTLVSYPNTSGMNGYGALALSMAFDPSGNLFAAGWDAYLGTVINKVVPTTPTLGTFAIPAKTVGAAAFSVTAPTSTNTAAFTFTSSNAAVATVTTSGTITVVGAGTTTITATQPTNGTLQSAPNWYAGASVQAPFTVYSTPAYAPKSFSYTTPNIYGTGTAITPLTPSANTTGAVTTLATGLGNGGQSITGLVNDAAGNVYIADNSNSVVKKVSATGVVTVLASGFVPTVTAIDAAGNLYVGDATNNVIKKIATDGTISTFLSNSSIGSAGCGLTLDAAGNVYAVGNIPGNRAIFKIATNGTITQITSGLNTPNLPVALVVDGLGNLYMAAGNVFKIDVNGNLYQVTATGYYVSGVAVDSYGNLYLSDYTNRQIKKVTPNGTVSVLASSWSWSSYTNHVGVDASGNVYTTSYNNSLNTNNINKICGEGGTAGSSYSISPALPTGLSLNTSTGVISGTPLVGMAATNFTVTATNAVGSTSATFAATVYQYAPSNFTYNSPDTLSAGGATQAPKLVASGITTTVNSGFSYLRNIAVDAAGNVYAVDNGLTSIKKITPSGTVTTIGSGFNKPNGVAVDAAGNVYVGDQINNAVKKIPYSNGTYGSVTSVGSGYSNPAGVAVDAIGNVYVADVNNNVVRMVTPGGSVNNIGSGFNRPVAVALDATGNVYVADSANNAVKEIPYISSGNYGTPITLGSGFSKPTAIAVDNIFNVYVADNGNNAFKKIASNGTVSTIASGVGNPRGIAVDASGNVYLADGATNTIKKITGTGGAVVSYSISPALPAGLTIDSATGVISGTPLAATTKTAYTVTATNTGGTNSTILELTTFVTNTWTGATSTDWGTTTNWANNILPTSNSGIIISATAVNQPVLGTDVSIQGLILNGSINLNGHNLTLARSQSGSGNIIAAGTANLTFAKGTSNIVGKLIVNGGALTVSGALSITKELDVNAGTLNTGGNITLKSTSITNTAIVGPVGGTINGNVNIERFIPAGWRAYRDIAPELYGAGSIFANWQEGGKDTTTGIFITGPSATMPLASFTGTATSSNPTPGIDGLDYSINGNASAFNYLNGTWSSITNTTTTNLDPFTGYRVLVRGSRHFNLFKTEIITYGVGEVYYYTNLRMHDATTLRTNGGQLIAGNVTYSTIGTTGKTANGTSISSSSAALNSTPSGFSMVANPYVSPVLWGTGLGSNGANTVYGNSTNINGTFWYLAPTSGTNSNYLAFNALTGSAATLASLNYAYAPLYSSASGYIQPGQAFFVQTATNGSPTVNFTEATKGSTANLYNTFGISKPLSKIYFSLLKQDSATRYSQVDAAAVAFRSDFGNTVYGPQDATKIINASDNLFISDKGKNLSIDGRLPATATDVLPIALSKPSGKNYQLVIDASIYGDSGFLPVLKDNYKGTVKALSTGIDTITFTVDTTNAASYSNRFSIIFTPSALAVNSIVASASLNNKIATITWNTVGEKGESYYEVEKSTDGKNFNSIGQQAAKNIASASYSTTDNSVVSGNNYYRIKAVSATDAVNYSNIAKLTTNNLPLTTIYPNPLVGKTLNVSLSNVASGKYVVSIYNVLGQKVNEQTISHNGGSVTHALTINSTLAKGIYSVTIREAASNQIVHQTSLSVQP